MVIDHVNVIFFHQGFFVLQLIGRGAFPLFCYAVAAAVLRSGAGFPWRYVKTMSLLALASQPFYQFAVGSLSANVIFTLLAGGVFAFFAARWPLKYVYALYSLAVLSTLFLLPLQFGLAGVVLPSALLLALKGEKTVLPFLALLLFSINGGGMLEYLQKGVDGRVWPVFAATGMASVFLPWLVVDIAGKMRQDGRFLPKYALHAFYPLHLALLRVLAG